MHNELHHISVRKRIYEQKEPYPHPNRTIRFIDDAAYVFGVAGPLMTLPQLWEVWVNQQVAGVSIASWGAFCLISLFWFMYGIIHKTKPIIISQILWFILQSMIVVGVLLYS